MRVTGKLSEANQVGILLLRCDAWQENLDSIIQALVAMSSCEATPVKIFFFDKQDRSRFFSLLQEGIEKYRHRIHAYCLMTNHLHLAVQVGDVSLFRIIHNVSFRYTRYINRRRNPDRLVGRTVDQPGFPK